MKHIGIIGAGASGLCALRHVLATEGLTAIIWENSSNIGGTWVYSEKTGQDEFGYPIHSSMYKNLKTNIPKEIMAFPDFPIKDSEDSFVHHSKVLQYLNDYADNFKLKPWIKFRHHVDSISPLISTSDSEFPRWRVKVKDILKDEEDVVELDGVIICTGHYSKPRYPQIHNLNAFKGNVMHSHDYREPGAYHGLAVVVLGAAASGIDISLEISTVAKKVYLSHNLPVPFPSALPANMEQVKGVTGATSSGFCLKDGTTVQADAILFCTGYEYSFPFLSESCGVSVQDNRVTPLHKHLIHCKFPSMAFIGIPTKICPFPLFDVQVRYFVKVLSGEVVLPSEVEMVKESEIELQEKLRKGTPVKHFHVMGVSQWEYCAQLEKLADLVPLPKVISMVHTQLHAIRRKEVTKYKSIRCVIKSQDSFEFIGDTSSL